MDSTHDNQTPCPSCGKVHPTSKHVDSLAQAVLSAMSVIGPQLTDEELTKILESTVKTISHKATAHVIQGAEIGQNSAIAFGGGNPALGAITFSAVLGSVSASLMLTAQVNQNERVPDMDFEACDDDVACCFVASLLEATKGDRKIFHAQATPEEIAASVQYGRRLLERIAVLSAQAVQEL